MSVATTMVGFGEWLPDQPEFGEGLQTADGLIPQGTHYLPYSSLTALVGGGGTLPATAGGMFYAIHPIAGIGYYAGTVDQLYLFGGAGSFSLRSAATYGALSGEDWDFVQFDDQVIAVQGNALPQSHTIGSATNFFTLNAPKAHVVGRVGEFVMLGYVADTIGGSTMRANRVRWCAITDETNWPTPNSATAIATQAGEQLLPAEGYAVQKITSGDQHALIFQTRGITRVTYAGPPVVFQFDQIDNVVQLRTPGAAVQVGSLVYFIANEGVYVTDGVTVKPIGHDKVDKWFDAHCPASARIVGSYDEQRKVVMWFYGTQAAKFGGILFYHTESGQFATATQDIQAVIQKSDLSGAGVVAINTSKIISFFDPTITANALPTLVTREVELSPGGFARVTGVRPIFEGASNNAQFLTIYTKNTKADTATAVASITANARTGSCDFLAEGRYHKLQANCLGTFSKAVGIEFQWMPTSKV